MWTSEPKSDREYYLEQELEDARRREEEARQQEKEAREQRQRERQQQLEENYRTASTWPEALNKQEYLFRREFADQVRFEHEHNLEHEIDDWFEPGANACAKALEYWKEEESAIADEIKELEQKITDLRSGIAGKVADRLDNHEGMLDGWYHIAGDLREYDEDDLDRWLYW